MPLKLTALLMELVAPLNLELITQRTWLTTVPLAGSVAVQVEPTFHSMVVLAGRSAEPAAQVWLGGRVTVPSASNGLAMRELK